MNSKATIFLIILAVVAASALVWVRSCATGTSSGQAVFGVVSSEIESLRVLAGGDFFELRCKDGEWQVLAQKRKDRADMEVIEAFLEKIARLVYFDKLMAESVSSEERKMYGLASPKTAIILRTTHGEKKLFLGRETAFRGRLYAAFDPDGDIYIVEDTIQPFIEMNWNSFRDRKLSAANPEQVDSFSIKTTRGEMTLARTAGGWKITKPLSDIADDEIVKKYLVSVLKAPLAGFVSDSAGDLTAYGIVEGCSEISLMLNGFSTATILRMGKEVPQNSEMIFAQFSERNAVVLLPTISQHLGEVTPDHFRDKRLARINLDMADRLRIASPANEKSLFVFDRLGKNWRNKILGLEKTGLEKNAVLAGKLTTTLNSAQIEKFLSGERDLGQAIIEIEFLAVLDEEKFEGRKVSLGKFRIGQGTQDNEKKFWVVSERGVAILDAADAQGILDAAAAITTNNL